MKFELVLAFKPLQYRVKQLQPHVSDFWTNDSSASSQVSLSPEHIISIPPCVFVHIVFPTWFYISLPFLKKKKSSFYFLGPSSSSWSRAYPIKHSLVTSVHGPLSLPLTSVVHIVCSIPIWHLVYTVCACVCVSVATLQSYISLYCFIARASTYGFARSRYPINVC